MSGSINISIPTRYCIIHCDDGLRVRYSYREGEEKVDKIINARKRELRKQVLSAYEKNEFRLDQLITPNAHIVAFESEVTDSKVVIITNEDVDCKTGMVISVEIRMTNSGNLKIIQDTVAHLIQDIAIQ